MGLKVDRWDVLTVVQLGFLLVGAYVVSTRAFDWLYGPQVSVPEDERGED